MLHSTNVNYVRGQRGAILIIALVMLLVITMLGTGSLTSVTLEERMVSNMQSANKAFEGAEAALAQCENLIRSSTVSELEVGGILGVVDYGTTSVASERFDSDFWLNQGTELQANNLVRSDTNPEGLVAAPRCLIELVGQVSSSIDLSRQYSNSADKLVYLITAFSLGADGGTQAVLESLFVKQ